MKTGGSYCSQSQLRLTFGLGGRRKIDLIEIKWPSGENQVLAQAPVNRLVKVDETFGIVD
jgi:hypothetical protein